MNPVDESLAVEGELESVRVDVWLWAVRLFKTRTLAAEACKKNQVSVNGQRVKPARQVRVGDELIVKKGALVRTVAVRALLSKRVAAKEVESYLEDRTTEEAWAAAAEARQRQKEGGLSRDDGAGRPTKKERRELDDIMVEAEEREALFRKLAKSMKNQLLILFSLVGISALAMAADPPKRSFEPSEKSVVFQLAENLSVSAEKLAPELDESTGAMKGLAASGHVIIKSKPKGAENMIVVACDKAVYQSEGDVIVLTGWPAVKSGMQILRATSEETYVRVERGTGKWAIKGPHRIDLSFGR
ncbi:MAG: RNA-binding S4 domain-containing protein [Verrucomicrobiae bacterium]|nr:RNA-binding S4 domain-containing protein [Verrucomicrobiae bacterium]